MLARDEGLAKGCHEQKHLGRGVAEGDAALAEVDLELTPRRGLEAHGGPCLGRELPAQVGDFALDGAQARRDALLGREFLPHDIGVAGVTAEAHGEPGPNVREGTRAITPSGDYRPARGEAGARRYVAAAEFARSVFTPDLERHSRGSSRAAFLRPG